MQLCVRDQATVSNRSGDEIFQGDNHFSFTIFQWSQHRLPLQVYTLPWLTMYRRSICDSGLRSPQL